MHTNSTSRFNNNKIPRVKTTIKLSADENVTGINIMQPNKAVTGNQKPKAAKAKNPMKAKKAKGKQVKLVGVKKPSSKKSSSKVSGTAPIDYNDLAPGVRVANGLQ